MRSCTSSRYLLGSKVGIYMGLFAITNNYRIIHVCNNFYLLATLSKKCNNSSIMPVSVVRKCQHLSGVITIEHVAVVRSVHMTYQYRVSVHPSASDLRIMHET